MDLIRFRKACKAFGLTEQAAIDEKAAELEQRLLLKCVPDLRLEGDDEVVRFLAEVLGYSPPQELVEAVRIKRRGPGVTQQEWNELEKTQAYRCAICGRRLCNESSPHLDHVIAVALGGVSFLSNYQILCADCNSGKRALQGWVSAQPFLSADRPSGGRSLRLRYAVLARCQGQCQRHGCDHTVEESELMLHQVIPTSRGGRWIFDNLLAFCQPCRTGAVDAEYSRTRFALQTLGTRGGWQDRLRRHASRM